MTRFNEIAAYGISRSEGYRLLPIRFTALDADTYVVTNIAGEFTVLSHAEIESLVKHRLDTESPLYADLRARHFLQDSVGTGAPDLLALKLRTRHQRLAEFTSLHLFVVTLRCEHSCPYCQVSRQTEDRAAFDMTPEIADRALEFVFRSPAQALKIEFQGGESLLNFPLIRHIVLRAKQINANAQRTLGFVIATNLAVLDDEILDFCASHEIEISTSLDGPPDLHNRNRPRPGRNSYEKAVVGIKRCREALGRDKVSALMTTTASSMSRVTEIIDEYVALEFPGIFLRALSPYGFAVRTKAFDAYNTDQWIAFYIRGLEYIIDLNRSGIPFKEFFSSVILTKMLTSNDPGYVDLSSPAGIGIRAIVYNYDGRVFASDESRMLAEMGNDEFCIGNVKSDSYEAVMLSDRLLRPLEESITTSAPMCSDCAFEPYCGSDPVYHHAMYGDYLGRKAESDFCRRNMAIFKYLVQKMRSDDFARQLFLQWANRA